MDSCSIFANAAQGVMVWNGAGSFIASKCEVYSHKFECGVIVAENSKDSTFTECSIYSNELAGICVQEKGRAPRLARSTIIMTVP
jgi:hypothetical protein